MKIAIIAPPAYLDLACITDHHYVLPGLLVDDLRYRNFYQERQAMGHTIIMDTKRIGWRREPEDFDTVEKAMAIVKPDMVILPSIMFQFKRTFEVAKDFMQRFKVNGVFCIEGTSPTEVENALRKFGKRSKYAVPSHMYNTCKTLGHPPTVFIENHTNMDELDGFGGILATSLPVRLGLEGRILSDYLPTPPSLTFKEDNLDFEKIVVRNVKETISYYSV